jgi:squalene cyclase
LGTALALESPTLRLCRAADIATAEVRERLLDRLYFTQNPDGGWGEHGKSNAASTGQALEAIVQADGPGSWSVRRAVAALRRWQMPSGCWTDGCGRVTTRATWSALSGLAAAEAVASDSAMRRGAACLVRGKILDAALNDANEQTPTAPIQAAWTILGLIAAGQARNQAAVDLVGHLVATQTPLGGWDPPGAESDPRCCSFPLLALSRWVVLRDDDGAGGDARNQAPVDVTAPYEGRESHWTPPALRVA